MNNYQQMSSANYHNQWRDKNIASLLAIFLGWTGVHKFYLGQVAQGVLYAVFSFTFIPFFLSLVDFFRLVTMGHEEFNDRYNDNVPFTTPRNWRSGKQYGNVRRTKGGTVTFEKNKGRASTARPVEVTYRTTIPRAAGLNSNKAYQEGIRLFNDYQYRNALERFTDALLVNRDHPEVLFRIACCNSLLEQKEEMFSNLDKAIKKGFKDFDKIQTMDALAFLRIQKEYDAIKASGYTQWTLAPEDEERNDVDVTVPAEAEAAPAEDIRQPLSTDELLAELKKLGEMRQNGQLTEEQFAVEKQKLFA